MKERKITHADKVLYPENGLTKGQIAAYYAMVADSLLPHVVERPLMVLRCPEGRKQCFFQKHANGTLKHVAPIPVTEEDGEERDYISIDDEDGLFDLVQAGVLEFHPWASGAGDVEKPDRIIFDLDPGPGVTWKAVIEAALLLKDRLAEFGLKSFVKTSGGKGLHVYAPVRKSLSWDMAKGFARVLAEDLAAKESGKYLATAQKSKREGHIFVDYLRTGRGSTCVAAYSPRARPNAPVSTPLRWDELPHCQGPAQYTVANLQRRLDSLSSDPWEGFFELDQAIDLGLAKAGAED